MKTLLKVYLLFILFVIPWDARGEKGVVVPADYQTQTIKAAESSSITSTQHFGESTGFDVHQRAEEVPNFFNTLSCLDSLNDSRDNTSESTFVEASVQRYASIFLKSRKIIEPGITTRKLIFPFHNFL